MAIYIDSPEVAERIEAKLDAIMRRLDVMKMPEQPALTVVAFAKRVGKHPNTIHRKISRAEIIKRNGLIPHTELRKFLS